LNRGNPFSGKTVGGELIYKAMDEIIGLPQEYIGELETSGKKNWYCQRKK